MSFAHGIAGRRHLAGPRGRTSAGLRVASRRATLEAANGTSSPFPRADCRAQRREGRRHFFPRRADRSRIDPGRLAERDDAERFLAAISA